MRPPITTRTLAGSAGSITRQSQWSSIASSSKVSRIRTTRSPRAPTAAAASSTVGAAERGQELALRGGHDVAVELDHGGAGARGLAREGVQQRRLSDTGEAVDVGHDRPVGLEQPPQQGPLALASGDLARLLREQASERLGHDVRRYGPDDPAVIGAGTSYDAGDGLDDAVPVRLPEAPDRRRLPAHLVGRPAGRRTTTRATAAAATGGRIRRRSCRTPRAAARTARRRSPPPPRVRSVRARAHEPLR